MIERHLAHGSDEEWGGAYDCATFLNQRHKMIQVWADLLDDLAARRALAMPACTELATVRGNDMSVVEAGALAGALPTLTPDSESRVDRLLWHTSGEIPSGEIKS